MLFTTVVFCLFILAALAIFNQPPRAIHTDYAPGCQVYGCALPVGFKGWPQL
jgi:hypothetical protein